METWERYELLLFMLSTAAANNSTPRDNNIASWRDAKQAYILTFSDLNRGESAGLLLNLNFARLQNIGTSSQERDWKIRAPTETSAGISDYRFVYINI
jgi:hypothetical protein